ncbi:MAG TPA: hypothetical protein VGN12_13920 [Pirellulales bacterium]
MRSLLLLIMIVAGSGCTHRQLSRSMIHQASTIMGIEYQMVLDNMAMLSVNPAILPWAIRINDGTVQVNDEGGMPELGVQWGSTPGFTRGIRAVRSVTEQWGAHPITDPLVVKTLQDVYRQAMGLPPAADPPLLAQLSASADSQEPAKGQTAETSSPAGPDADRSSEELPPGPSSAGANVSDVADNLGYAGSPLAQIRGQLDVPVGWFCVGCKRDVPKDACFVGHYCDRYVWVMPDRVEDLSHFTLIVLGITKHGVSSGPGRGLAYVRH